MSRRKVNRSTNNAWCVDTVTFMGLASPVSWAEVQDWMPQSWEIEPDLRRFPKQDDTIRLFGSMGKHPDDALEEKEHRAMDPLYYQLGFQSFEAYEKFKAYLGKYTGCDQNTDRQADNVGMTPEAYTKFKDSLEHYETNREKRLKSEKFVRKFQPPKPSKNHKPLPPVVPTELIGYEEDIRTKLRLQAAELRVQAAQVAVPQPVH